MDRNLFKICVFSILLIFSLGLVSAEDVNVEEIIVDEGINVDIVNEINDGVISEEIITSNDDGDYNFTWLRDEIYSKDIVDLGGKTVKWNDSGKFLGGISIIKTVTIKNGIIDASDEVSFFNVMYDNDYNKGNLILENIILKNGKSSVGVIYNNEAKIIFNNCVLENTNGRGVFN